MNSAGDNIVVLVFEASLDFWNNIFSTGAIHPEK